jgi:hypothetical protein
MDQSAINSQKGAHMKKRDPVPLFFIKNPFLLKLWLALTVLTSLAFYAQ